MIRDVGRNVRLNMYECSVWWADWKVSIALSKQANLPAMEGRHREPAL